MFWRLLQMRKIFLSKDKHALVDNEDYEFINKWKWHYSNGYAVRRVHIHVGKGVYKGKYIYMHRLLLNAEKSEIVDHKNRDALDNRKNNLRICTQAQNCQNQVGRTNKYGYKGVYFAFDRNKFAAKITFNKKRLILGYFETALEAGKAYNRAAIKYHKEFARLNNV